MRRWSPRPRSTWCSPAGAPPAAPAATSTPRRTAPRSRSRRRAKILDELAAMGVFHVALGGGEALELDYLFEVAAHARAVGITPNLTTSGLGLTPRDAERCRVFGQINVSVDGVGEGYRRARGFDGFAHAERGLRLLRAVKEEV